MRWIKLKLRVSLHIVDYKYGDNENVSVLYNGDSFKASSGVVYLNISDFVREITRCKDVKAAMQNLSGGLPVRDLELEETGHSVVEGQFEIENMFETADRDDYEL